MPAGLVDALSRSATEALPETIKLIDDGRLVLETQRRGSRQLVEFSTNFAELAETLKGSDGDLRVILDRGAIASRELDALIRENRGPLVALLANLITVGQVGDDGRADQAARAEEQVGRPRPRL